MRPLHLRLEHFGSFDELDLDFDGLSLVAVVGENGAGKSTLLTAMLVALYGAAVGALDGFVRHGAHGFKVVLDFESSGAVYRVVREYGRAQKVSLSRDGEPLAIDKVREADAAIIEAVGYDYPSFTTAHWLRQGDLGRFAALDPASRKEWLVAAIGLDVWPKMEAVTKKRLAAERSARTANEATLSALPQYDINAVEEEHAQVVGLIEAAKRATDDAAEKEAQATDAYNAAAPALASVRRARSGLDEAQKRVHDARVECDRLEAEVARVSALAKDKVPELPDIDSLERKVASLQSDRLAYTKAAARAESLLRDLEAARATAQQQREAISAIPPFDATTCQTCGQPISGEAHDRAKSEHDASVERASARLKESSERLAALESEASSAEKSVPDDPSQALSSAESALASARRVEAQHQQRKEAQARVDGLVEALASASRTLEQYSAAEEQARDELERARQVAEGIDIDALERDKEYAAECRRVERERLDSLYRDEARLTERLAALEESADKRARAEAALAESERHASDLELLAKAYGKGGIQARILDVAVRVIEQEANEYLSRFASGMTLSMSTQRENKTGGIRETLDILVTDGLGTRPLERMSGGETTRANFALAVGLARFLARQGGSVESFVVDEPEYLDSRGMSELVSCLHALADDVPLVLVVSHIESITDSLPQQVVVKRGRKGSEVVLR